MKPVLNEYGAVCCINHLGKRCPALTVNTSDSEIHDSLDCTLGGKPNQMHHPDFSFRPSLLQPCPLNGTGTEQK